MFAITPDSYSVSVNGIPVIHKKYNEERIGSDLDELVNSFGKYTLVKNGDKKYYVFTLTEDVCMIVSPGYGMATGSVDFIYMGYEKDGSVSECIPKKRYCSG